MGTVGSANFGRGIVAGFVATIGLSALMLMKQATGVMPQLNPVEMITQMMGAQTPIVGWVINFFIGSVMWTNKFQTTTRASAAGLLLNWPNEPSIAFLRIRK